MLRKLAGQTAIYGISTIVARLLNYLLTPYLTRIMSPEQYGVVTDMYALIPFALVLLTMGLETGYFRFAGAETTAEGKRKVFATTWGATLSLAALFFIAVMFFIGPVSGVMGYGNHRSYVMCVAAIVALDVATAIPFVRLRERGKALMFVTLKSLSILINVVLTIFFFAVLPSMGAFDTDFGVGYVFAANLAANIVVFILLMFTVERIAPRIERKLLWAILLYSLPLLISGIAGTANEYIDRQMIKYLMPEDIAMSSLGIYGAVAKIAVVMTLFTQMYRLGAEPFFLARFKGNEFQKVNAEALKYYSIASLTILLTISLFSDLFALIVGRDFREGMFILPIILLTNTLNGLTYNLSFWYKQTSNTKYAIIITGTGLVVTIVLMSLFVPLMGYAGAAWAALVCSAVTTVVSYILNQRYLPTPYDLPRIGLYFALAAVIYAVGIAIDCAAMAQAIKYGIYALLVITFVIFAIRKEGIDALAIIKSIVKR